MVGFPCLTCRLSIQFSKGLKTSETADVCRLMLIPMRPSRFPNAPVRGGVQITPSSRSEAMAWNSWINIQEKRWIRGFYLIDKRLWQMWASLREHLWIFSLLCTLLSACTGGGPLHADTP